jgi:hypothetical protein
MTLKFSIKHGCVRNVRGGRLAMDGATPVLPDGEYNEATPAKGFDEDAMTKAMQFLAMKGLSKEDLMKVGRIMVGRDPDDAGAEDDEVSNMQVRGDPVIAGDAAIMHRARRGQAMASADNAKGFAERFPDGAKIRGL